MGTSRSQDDNVVACQFAARAHQGKYVTGTELPYLLHLSLVSMEVMVALGSDRHRDADLAIQCAWLHDTLEDTQTTYAELKAAFGTQVADGVAALTKDETLSEAQQMRDSLRRIVLQPPEVWMVKLADRITNLQKPPSDWTKEKMKRYQAEAVEIYQALKQADETLAARLLEKTESYRAYFE